jgi:probable F420-dependent oxidoreductase
VVLAKALATVDVLSGGRVIVGAGIGYLEAEFQAIGVPMARRGRRTEEYIAAMRALWSSNETFHGEFVSFTDAYSNPKPVRGTIPIILGGASVAAARRAGRIADGFYPMPGTDLETLLAELRSAAVEAGRDPDAITLMAGLPRRPETIRRLADLGFTRLLLPPPMCPPEQIRADLEARLAEAREHVS